MGRLRRRVPDAAGTSVPAPETPVLILSDVQTRRQKLWLCLQCAWKIEIFFRMFKHLLGCRHQLSYCEDGIRLQTYAAILACLLIALWTGRKPTVRTYEMFSYYLTGLAEEDELLAHIAGLKEQPVQA
jgi:hypothetical protein